MARQTAAPSEAPITGRRSAHLRNHNLSSIAKTVILAPTAPSRSEVATTTGLNRSTVSRLVDDLIEFGILAEGDSDLVASGGRPRTPLFGARRTHVSIGIEIGQTFVDLILLDLHGSTLVHLQRELALSTLAPAEVFDIIGTLLSELLEQIIATHMSLAGITVGLPGLIDKSTHHLVVSPNFNWRDFNLSSFFRKGLPPQAASRIGEVPVRFENSASLSAFNELVEMNRNAMPYEDFLLVTGTTGIGSCLVRNHAPVEGTHGWAGELGHAFVAEGNRPCSCGSTGCLESFAACEPLMEAAGLSPSDPIAHLVSQLRRHDKQAVSTVDNAARLLGRALGSYINLVDIQHIVLGGIPRILYEQMPSTIEMELKQRVLSYSSRPTEFSTADSLENSVVRGAAWRSLIDFIEEPSWWVAPSEFARNHKSLDSTKEISLEL